LRIRCGKRYDQNVVDMEIRTYDAIAKQPIL
jgi:hypothetical protein